LTGRVDVIIAAWNRADTIERALLSALSESEVGAVIVIDDCSIDDTGVLARRIAADYGRRVMVSRLPVNRGPAAARNVGLELSTAPWAAVLDGDDFFLPGRIGDLLSHAGENDFVADNLIQVQEGQEHNRESCLLEGYSAPWQLNLEGFVLGNVHRPGRLRRELGFLKPMMRRSFIDRHRLRYDETLRLGEDYAFYARALALGARFVITPARGYVSVERPDSLSGHHTMQDLERLRDVDLDLGRVGGLTTAERRAIRRHYDCVDAKAQWIAVINSVKARSVSQFIAPFLRSWTVSTVLIKNLIEEAYMRGSRWLRNLSKP
jgi:succinoglycan biosynthesis protein ExoU